MAWQVVHVPLENPSDELQSVRCTDTVSIAVKAIIEVVDGTDLLVNCCVRHQNDRLNEMVQIERPVCCSEMCKNILEPLTG